MLMNVRKYDSIDQALMGLVTTHLSCFISSRDFLKKVYANDISLTELLMVFQLGQVCEIELFESLK